MRVVRTLTARKVGERASHGSVKSFRKIRLLRLLRAVMTTRFRVIIAITWRRCLCMWPQYDAKREEIIISTTQFRCRYVAKSRNELQSRDLPERDLLHSVLHASFRYVRVHERTDILFISIIRWTFCG